MAVCVCVLVSTPLPHQRNSNVRIQIQNTNKAASLWILLVMTPAKEVWIRQRLSIIPQNSKNDKDRQAGGWVRKVLISLAQCGYVRVSEPLLHHHLCESVTRVPLAPPGDVEVFIFISCQWRFWGWEPSWRWWGSWRAWRLGAGVCPRCPSRPIASPGAPRHRRHRCPSGCSPGSQPGSLLDSLGHSPTMPHVLSKILQKKRTRGNKEG